MSSESKASKTDIAVIGMACRFPGAPDYNAFWDNLKNGVNSIEEVPPERWKIERYYSSDPKQPNKSISKWYGLIDTFNKFDNRFFNISPGEARYMDPQQRLLLEESWHCIEDSGVPLTELQEKRTDVYVGKADWDYILNALSCDINIHTVLGNHSSLSANRISYVLGLKGASLTLDTACSSSLFAAEKAREALLSLSAEYALVASACVHCHPLKYIGFSKAHIVSPDGQCKTFDKDADGFVLGDGVGVLLLQRLDHAVRKKRHIYGIIKGVATNHGGSGVTISSPQIAAQAEVLAAAYEQSGCSPDSINYIEAHGTGTLIGDPIEVAALTKVFRQHTDKKQFCYIGSVKTNIGHTGGAAGMAGIIKVLMMMRAAKIPPNLNFNTPNPVIDFDDSPFQVPTQLCDWVFTDKKSPLRAGVSAFGFGGANAHMVLEAHPSDFRPEKRENGKALFTLSAKSEQSLAALLESWKAFASSDQFKLLSMNDICKTLTTGRESFSLRLGCMVANHDELLAFLNAPPAFCPIHDRPSICLRIGEFDWKGFEDLKPLLKESPLFEQEIERMAEALERSGVKGEELHGLRRGKWTANHQLYRFMTGYAFLKSFLETGNIVPDLLTGEAENSGFLTALTISKALSVDDALSFLSGRLNAAHIVLSRPEIAFFDPVAGKPVTPYHFDSKYLKELKSHLSITDKAAAGYLSKAESMLDNQFTFKSYVAEWDAVLKTRGSDIHLIINDERRFADEKPLFSVIIANCIRKLNRKWDISEKPVDASPEFFEIVDLITDNVMPKEIAIALLQDEKPDFEAIADTLNQNQKRINAATLCTILKRQKLTEIEDFAGWLKKAENRAICKPEEMLCFDFGWLNSPGQVKDPVVMDMGDDPAVIVEKTMLKLWLKGVDTNFRTLYPDGSFQKVSLPVYPFKGEAYWLPEPGEEPQESRGKEVKLHPLVHRNSSDLSEQRFSSTFTGDEFFLEEHRVESRKVLPGVAHLEMARCAMALAAGASEEEPSAIVLRSVAWLRPIVSEDGPVDVNIALFPLENREIGYEIYQGTGTAQGQEEAPSQLFSQGRAILQRIQEVPVSDIEALKAQCNRRVISGSDHYGRLKEAGLELGLSFQGIETIYAGDGCALARLVLPSAAQPTMEGFLLHPGLLDSALQTASCLFDNSGPFELSIPFTLKSIEIYSKTASPMWSFAVKTIGSATREKNRVLKFDVELYDESGTLCARVLEISFRKPKFEADTAMGSLMLSPCWKEEATDARRHSPDYYQHLVLVCSSADGVSETVLKERLNGAEIQIISSEREAVDEQFGDYATRIFQVIQAEILSSDLSADRSTEGILTGKPGRKKLLQVVLSGGEINPWLYGLSGLLKTARLENPGLICQLIETDSIRADGEGGIKEGGTDGCDPATITQILTENMAYPEDIIIRYVSGKRQVERIEEIEKRADSSVFSWKEGCICLITGGLGGLGLIFAREILQKAKEATLILTGRSEPDAAKLAMIEELKASGARVEYWQADVGKKDDVIALIANISSTYGKLTGIIHSAGVISDNYMVRKSVDEFETVMAPKVRGLVNLDLATKELPLDFFIIFSSMAGSLGNIGQADYACANAFAGGYAAYRNQLVEMNQRHGRTVSIDWPLWKEGGMRVDIQTEKMMWQNMGMATMERETGIRGFYQCIAAGDPHMMFIEGDLPTIRQKLISVIPFSAPETLSVPAAVADADRNEICDRVRSILIDEISRMMGIQKESIESRAALERYGFDSITLTEFTNRLNSDYCLELAPTLFFEYPDVESLSKYLAAEHGAAFAVQPTGKVRSKSPLPSPARDGSDTVFTPKRVRPRFAMALSTQNQAPHPFEPVAIVGISGRFPMAEGIDAFWENLADAKSCITEIPEERWDWKALNAGSCRDGSCIRWGGFMDNVKSFDPSFFEISPREAELMDPQQRLLMLYAWKAIEDAAILPASLAGTKTGIFVGTGGNQYAEIIARANIPVESYTSTGSVPSVGPNRMSYFLDIHGPSEPVETSCSSSLVAIHRAVEAMANGSCDMAIVGGVNTIITPGFHLSFGNAGMLSRDGKCKSFSDQADGYVRGEAVGMLFLKKLSAARESRDHIYGVIRGSAVNHGGRSSSLTAPNPKAQTEVLMQAYRRAGIDPRTVGYIEAHGTGTPLGDPIEIEALKAAFKNLYSETGSADVAGAHCGLGSVKSNIGHTELASGVAGVIKVLLQIRNRRIARTLHCDTVNPYIRLENTPFYIASEAREWASPLDASGRPLPRRAGVSSFGFGGANAHVVIEEYIGETANDCIGNSIGERLYLGTGTQQPSTPYLFVLSAKNQVRLKDYARKMADFLIRAEQTNADLADIAYTTQTGREAMEERLGLITGSVVELVEKLSSFAAGEENIQGLYRGNVRQNRETITVFGADDELLEAVDKWILRGKYSKLLSLWVKGLTFDWNRLYGEVVPKRISLPTYPFARDQYWIDGAWQMDQGIERTGTCESLTHHSPDLKAESSGAEIEKAESARTGGSPRTGFMMLKRSWQEKLPDATGDTPEYEKHVIALCCGPSGASDKPVDSIYKSIRGAFEDAEVIDLEPGTQTIDRRFSQCALKLFEVIRATLKEKPRGRVLFQVVIPKDKDSGMDYSLFSGLSGLLKTAHLENPKVLGQLIEIDRTEIYETEIDQTDRLAAVLIENSKNPEEAHIRYSDGRRLVTGLEEIRGLESIESLPEHQAMPWKDGGVYLITGGTGGLGLIFAEEIAACVKSPILILTGRTAPLSEKQARIDALRHTGARVEFRQSDLSLRADVAKSINGIVADFGKLNAIIHSAGVIRDNFIINKSQEEFETVLAPKVTGITSLDEASADLDLDFFVVFSSGVGAHGNTGQADYACANAYMDAYILYRDSLVKEGNRKGKSLSIEWPPWKEGGMPIDMVTEKMAAQGVGMAPMETERGIRAFYHAFSLEHPLVMPMEGDLLSMRRHMTMTGGESKSLRKLAGLEDMEKMEIEPEILYEKIEQRLKRLIAEATRVGITDIGPDEPFENFGIDSFMIARLNGELEKLSAAIPKTLFYEYRTVKELTRHIITDYPRECMEWAGLDPGDAALNPARSGAYNLSCCERPVSGAFRYETEEKSFNAKMAVQGRREPIAIIGVSGRYPLAENLNEYWENLKSGRDCIREIPEERWPLEGFFHPDPDEAVARGKSYCRWGGFIDGFADFDPLFFNISPKEGMNMDPQERLFIEACWEVLEDAGYTGARVKRMCGGRVGVFAGITKTGFELYGPDLWQRGETAHPNTSFGSLANRVSYLFDFKGPSMPVDTMCSSSLTAIHEACEHLYRNECEMAVAGGVNLYLHPSTYIRLCSLRMLTTDSKNRSFGQGGDGFLPGEGVGAVLLKPLGRALTDNDPIYALIRGTGINHGGRTGGYTIPSPVAQAELIRSVMEKAGVTPQEISYVEAHGTGTELGDPIEISGLTHAFGKDSNETISCAIGSAKSNIGHLEAAAGIAGLTKIILQMQNGLIAPSLHAEKLNPNIDFHKTPFAVQQKLDKWRQPEIDGKSVPRIAGLSSFGAGGANAHIIIEEFRERRPEMWNDDKSKGEENRNRQSADERSGDPAIFVLSAKNEERLKVYAAKMATYLHSRPDLNLGDVTYTVQTGREPMNARIAMVVDSVAKIEEKLQLYIADQDEIEDFYRGSTKGNRDFTALFQTDEDLQGAVRAWVAKKKYDRLLNSWVKGLDFDWNLLYEDRIKPGCISLPTYPFAEERYWPVKKKSFGQLLRRDEIRPAPSEQAISLPQEEQTELMTFEEYLHEAQLDQKSHSAGSRAAVVRTLVCFLADAENQATVSEALKNLAPKTHVVFLTPTDKEWTDKAPDGDGCEKSSLHHYRIFNGESGSLEKAFASILKDYGSIDAGFYMAPLEDPESVRDFSGIVSCIKAIDSARLNNIRFLLAARLPKGPERCYPESWVGFERSLGLVMPRMQLGVVVEEVGTSAGTDMAAWAQRLWWEVTAERVESAVYKNGKRYVYRIRPTEIKDGENLENLVKPDHTYLITGGCGGLGALFARHLVKKHPVNLILTGRSLMDEKREALLREIETLNPHAGVGYLQADISDPVAMGKGLSDFKKRFGPINGVIHAAGIEETTTIIEKDIKAFNETLSPKISGTQVLDEILKGEPLDFICYFSSSAAILGDFGWCDYAVANRFLMAHGAYKKSQGAQTIPLVIHWPLWKEGGMGFDSSDSARTYLKLSGQRFLETGEGLALFDRLLSPKGGQQLVLAGEPSRIRQFLGLGRGEAQVSHYLVPGTTVSGEGRQTGMEGLTIEECLEHDLKNIISRLLAIPYDQLDPDVNLAEIGFDSVTLTELGARVSDLYSIDLSPALFFEHNTIEKLVEYIVKNHKAVLKGVYGEPFGKRVPASMTPPGSPLSGRFHSGTAMVLPYFQFRRDSDMAAWLRRYPECLCLNGVPLNGGNDKRPCFWIHPLTGSVEPYLKIAQNMDINLPFFGIRSRGFGTERDFLDNIPDMASYYIEIISDIDPEGPYRLAGFSMGGVIAYEMARQLQEKGKRVDNLLLLEPPFPSGTAIVQAVDLIALAPETIITTANFFLYSHMKNSLDSNGLERVNFTDLTTGKLKGDALIEHLASLCKENGVRQPVELIQRTIKNICYAFAHNKKALASFTVSPLPSPKEADIYYFIQSTQNLERSEIYGEHQRHALHEGTRKLLGDELTHDEDHYLKWKRLLPGLHTVRVPLSSHFDLLSDRRGVEAIIEKCCSIYQGSLNHDDALLKAESEGASQLHLSPKNKSARIIDDGSYRPRRAVAVVGMSGRFPMAEDPDEFWLNLAKGRDCITEIPNDRWDWEAFYGDPLKEGNRTDVKWGGFMENVGDFDPMFFGIAPREAEWMDPQQRLLMLYVWKAIEDAGYSSASISGSRTALFIGTGASGYCNRISAGGSDLEGYYGTAVLPAMGPNRMSYLLDLHGPSEPVDTTCSSSLVAICKAVEAIENGSCESAIAGGVNLIIDPGFHISLDRMGMLSKEGRCRTFSDRANGFVRGEGVGMLFLKPLETAEQEGAHIYGIIRGTAVNHGGRANSLTAPNPRAQVAVIKEAYEKAGIDPATVSYIEAHGTGTALGDPIEIDALKSAFKGPGHGSEFSNTLKPHCGLGSVKTNIGHLELAAGVAGVIKVLLQLKHKTIARSLHCDTLNPHIKLEGSPFYIAKASHPWNPPADGVPRRAGVSSFGAGGVNAHLVIEEYVGNEEKMVKMDKAGATNPGEVIGSAAPAIFLLSAKNRERLKNYALSMGEFFDSCVKNRSLPDLIDAAYTSQVGRDPMEERLAMVVNSVEELRDKLKAFGAEGRCINGVFCGNVKQDRETLALFTADDEFRSLLDKWVKRGNFARLLSLWVKGLDFEWQKLYEGQRPRRISLPTYPFAKERYWINGKGLEEYEVKGSGHLAVPPSSPETLTPLMTFEEYLEEQKIETSSGTHIRRLLCFLNRSDTMKHVEGAVQNISPETEVVFIVPGGDNYQKISRNHYHVSRSSGESCHKAVADILQEHGFLDAVIYMCDGIDAADISVALFHILKAMAMANISSPVRFLVAAHLEGADSCYADAWVGFERSLPMVMPKMQLGVICKEFKGGHHTDKADGVESASVAAAEIPQWFETLWQELHAQKIESAVYADGKRYVYRNRKTSQETIDSLESLIKPGKTYLITGGCGGLGGLVARYLAKRYGVNLILTGRSPMDERKEKLLEEIRNENKNAGIVYIQADICDANSMQKGMTKAKRVLVNSEASGSINGVIHAAGIESRGNILKKSVDAFLKVLRPKIQGTIAMYEAVKEEPLDFICYFSSSSAILGDFGGCDYAIANRFMASFARYRDEIQAKGKQIVIHWPLWRDGGMGFDSDGGTEVYLKSSGQRLLETTEGVELFDGLLSRERRQHLVLAGAPQRIRRFLRLLEDGPIRESRNAAFDPLSSRRRREIKGFSVAQCLEYDLKDHVGRLLGVDPDQLDSEANLADFGFDSILFAKFAALLTDFYSTEITPSIFFGNHTIGRLVHYFMQEQRTIVETFYAEAEKSANQPDASASPQKERGSVSPGWRNAISLSTNSREALPEAIAIIGMSGRFPGARSIDKMWEILKSGKEAVLEIPLERFDWRHCYGKGKKSAGPEIVSNRCGIVPGVSEFDSSFFEISPKEAGWMDPRQRLLLQESWRALEDAGYGPSHIRKNRMGVFVGMESGDYRSLSEDEKGITSDHEGVCAARLAYFLDFNGPAMAINTACSSGLVAAHQACLSLRAGECDTAIAAGVNIMLNPETFFGLSRSGMLSPSGRCYAFDKRADGMVPGEAVVSVIFKRLTDAERDNDSIYAVIRGSGINYDGKTNSITAPSQNAQTALLKDIYERYQINPEEITHIVTHGTGTKLGDSIEINALVDAFKVYTDKQRFCALTSTKTNFGHSFAASGLVSLVGIIQAMRHETIPESINFREENDYIKWSESPFYVNSAARQWNAGRGEERMGAVSAFGMSGTNAHMVVESHTGSSIAPDMEVHPFYLLLFSAKQKEALEEKIKDMATFFMNNQFKREDLGEISLTLSEGRHHFMHRTAVVVEDQDDALYLLNKLMHHEKSPRIFHGEVSRGFTGQHAIREYGEKMVNQAADRRGEKDAFREILYGLAELYCQGYEICLSRLIKPGKRSGLRLPTYPFARQQYWISETRASKVADLPREREEGVQLVDSKQVVDDKPAQASIPDSDQWDAPVSSGKASRITLTPLDRPLSDGKKPQTRRQITLSETSDQGSCLENMNRSPGNRSPKITLDIVPDAETYARSESDESEDPTSPRNIDLSESLPKKLRATLAESLYMDERDIDLDRPFTEMGMDSIIGVEWIKAINDQFGISIEAIKIYDYPTLREFAKFLAEKLSASSGKDSGNRNTSVMPGSSSPTEEQHCLKTPDRAPGHTPPKIALDIVPDAETYAGSDEDPAPPRNIALLEPLLKKLRRSLAEALYMDESGIDQDMPFTEMGMDSIIGVEWIKAINDQFGISIEAIKIYDYPSLRNFAKFLAERLSTSSSDSQSSAKTAEPLETQLPPASLEELLQQVQQGILDIEKADQLLQILENS